MKYDDSEDCSATLKAYNGLYEAVKRLACCDVDDLVLNGEFENVRWICTEFLIANPPMYTDTLRRMIKLIDLCRTKPILDNDLKADCIFQEVMFAVRELHESLRFYAVRGPVRRLVCRMKCWVFPPVIDVNMGYRRRYRGAYKLRLKQSEKIGKRLKEMKNETG